MFEAEPLITVIVLNLNGSHIMDVIREGLSSLRTMGWDNYELVLVDNGSTDGSREELARFLEGAGLRRYALVDAGRNLGFTGGCNLGFANRSPDSEITLLLNSDAVLVPGSIRPLARRLLSDPGLGAVNGGILDYWTGLLRDTPAFLDELHAPAAPAPMPPGDARAELEVTYPMGATALLRNDAVLEAGRGAVFDEEIFAYYDDTTLGLRLWSAGRRVLFLPVPSAQHVGGASSTSAFKLFHALRGRAALHVAAPGRYPELELAYLWRTALRAGRAAPVMAKAIREGFAVGRILRERYPGLGLYAAPVVRLTPARAAERALLVAGRVGRWEAARLSALVRGEIRPGDVLVGNVAAARAPRVI
jgi:GT2 family glycosyltransferase